MGGRAYILEDKYLHFTALCIAKADLVCMVLEWLDLYKRIRIVFVDKEFGNYSTYMDIIANLLLCKSRPYRLITIRFSEDK